MTNFAQNLAIIIGINQYQNDIAKLKTAKPDAEELANLLRDEYQYQVELITDNTDRKPTLKELENLLTKWLPEQLQPPAENNRLLFYFAGHGMPLESDDGPRGFLLPQDAHPNNPKTFLPMQVLHDALVALSCHHLLVILDCCFAGTFRWSTTRKAIPILETIHREHYDRFIRYPAWQVITSAAHDQEALDFLSDKRGIGAKSQHQAIQHSPFAEALFEALQNGDPDEKGRRYKKADLTKDGVITAPELYLYLRDNVETRSEERQTPGLYPLKKHDRGEYIFHDPNFDPQTLSKADPIDETNNPYRGLKPFEEEHARFFFGRQELIENLYARIAAPDHSLTVVLGVSGSGKSSLVKAGLIPYLRELSKPPINDRHQWHILNPIRPGESPFAALARTIWAIADMPITVELDSLGFLSEKLNQKTEQLNTQVAKASNKHGETSRTTQRLKQEAEKFAQITTTWNQDIHAAKQLLIVEHFETIYALCKAEGEPESQQQQQLKQVFLACLNPLTGRLQSAPNSLIEIVKAWSQKHPGVKLLLVIDQFEELITLSRKVQPNPQSDTPEEWQQFLQLLETTLAANLPQLRIIVTLRSDFEPRFLNSEALKSYWTRARFPVRAMRSDELRQAIEGPASEMALYFEPANLVDRLIDEVGQMPGALPLLSFTLSEFYIKLVQKWRVGESSDRALTIDAEFDKEGGVAGSLTRRANEEYRKIGDELGEAAQQTMRRVMLRMLTLEGGETARRRVSESELVYSDSAENLRVEEVIDQLVKTRLLVKGQEAEQVYVEPAHDFLVRGWDKLQGWLQEEAANVSLQQRLTPAAVDWENNNRDPEYLWIRDPRLQQLEKVVDSKTNNWLNRLEVEFVKVSKQKRQDELEETKRQLQISEKRRIDSEKQSINALTNASESFLKSNQQIEAIVAAIRSAKQAQSLGEVEFLDKALGALQRVIYATQERNRLQVDQVAMSLACSPDGKLLATGESIGTVRLWEISGREIAQLHKHDGWVNNAVFSPDGELLATCGQDSIIRLWNNSRQEFTCLEGHEGVIWNIQFSPKGNLLGSRGKDGTVRLWNTISSQQIAQFKSEQGDITSFAFSANGVFLAIGAEDGNIQLWRTSGNAPERVASFSDSDNSVIALAFSPTHDLLAAGAGGILQLWHTSGKLLESQQAYESAIWNLLFSPDGNVLAAGTFYDHVSMWDVSEQRLVPLFTDLGQAGGKYLKIAFSPNGKLFAVGCYDANVQLWSSSDWLTHSREGTQLRGHQGRIWDLAFSPDSKHLVTTGEDAIVRIWDTSIMKPVLLQEDKNDVEVAAFSFDIQDKGNTVTSPNGELIATIGEDNTVQLRNSDGSKLTQLKSYQGTVMCLAFSPDSNRLAIAGGDMGIPFGHGFLQLWDISTEKFTHFTTGSWYGVIYNLMFSPDGRRLVTYEGKDDTCRVWDLSTREIACFRNIRGVLAFSADGKQLVMRGDDDTVQLCQLGGLEELLAEACSMVCNYLQNNSKVSESDRHLCDHIETLN